MISRGNRFTKNPYDQISRKALPFKGRVYLVFTEFSGPGIHLEAHYSSRCRKSSLAPIFIFSFILLVKGVGGGGGGGLQILGLVGWALPVTGAKYPLERCGESNTQSSHHLTKINFYNLKSYFCYLIVSSLNISTELKI